MLKNLWSARRFRKPADESGGTAIDRGDELLTPTPAEDKPDPAAAEAALAAETAAAEAAAAAAKKDEKGEKGVEENDDEDEKPKKKDTRIPVARHEALLNKEREARADLERRLAQYEKGAKVADLNADITAAEAKAAELEKNYAKLVADGEVEKAAGVMNQIRQLDRQMAESKNDMKIAAAVAQATESARYNIALERVEEAYPVLNPDHDDFDEDLMTDVADLKVTYERRGLTPTAALQKAVAKLVKPVTVKQEAATEVKPRVDEKDIAAERKKAAVAKAVDTAKKTPPSTAKVGMDSDADGGQITAKDVLKMSFKDFSALNEEQLAKMRGDVI